jgi:hypothetical protein
MLVVEKLRPRQVPVDALTDPARTSQRISQRHPRMGMRRQMVRVTAGRLRDALRGRGLHGKPERHTHRLSLVTVAVAHTAHHPSQKRQRGKQRAPGRADTIPAVSTEQTAPCDCEPITHPDGHIIEHKPDCPGNYAVLHTAQDITAMREVVMTWAAGNQVDSPEDIQATRERMARGITARAVELGLEKP